MSQNPQIYEGFGLCMFHLAFPVLNVLIGVGIFAGNKQLQNDNYLFCYTLIAIFCFLAFFAVIKTIFWACDEIVKPKKINKIRRDLLFGFGGIALFGYIPEALALYEKEESPLLICSVITCHFVPVMLLLLFILPHLEKFRIRRRAFILRIFVIVLHVLLVIGLLEYVLRTSPEKFGELCIIVVYHTAVSVAFTADFLAVCIGAVMLRRSVNLGENPEGVQDSCQFFEIPRRPTDRARSPLVNETTILPNETPLSNYEEIKKRAERGKRMKIGLAPNGRAPETRVFRTDHPSTFDRARVVDEGAENSENPENLSQDEIDDLEKTRPHTGSQCNICFLEYSTTTVIPRILVGCGHTVCQGCIQNLPRELNDTVICPFCRKKTRLPDGLVRNLPKNFTVLDIIEERENGI